MNKIEKYYDPIQKAKERKEFKEFKDIMDEFKIQRRNEKDGYRR